MTTPYERRRNLIWGREALENLSTDAELPQTWSKEASVLLERYPPLSTLRESRDDDLEALQTQHGRVLAASKDLFQRLRGSPACSEQRRYTLLVILRHFY